MNRVPIITTLMLLLTLGVSFYTSAQVTKWKLQEKKASPKKVEKQMPYEAFDYAITGKIIKEKFEKWLEKTEYEKKSSYEERIKTKSVSAFYTICNREIEYEGDFPRRPGRVELAGYNADDGCFIVSFKNYHEPIGWIEWGRDKLSVPLSNAEKFKKRFDYFLEHSDKHYTLATNWVSVNNCFVATKITVTTPDYDDYDSNRKTSFKFSISVKEQRPIIYSTRSLKINNEKLSYIEFNYSDYIKERMVAEERKAREIEEEKRIIKEEQIKQEIAEKKALEQKIKKEKAENEQLFNQYVIAADTISVPEIKMLRKMTYNVLADVLSNNKEKISFYKKALSVMRNDEVQNKLDKSMAFDEEILKIMNQKQEKIKTTRKFINGAIRMIPIIL